MYSCSLLLVAVVVAGVAIGGTDASVGQCSGKHGMEIFEPKKAVGDWYEISGDVLVFGNTHCMKVSITMLNETDFHGDHCSGEQFSPRYCNNYHYTYDMHLTALDANEKVVTDRVVMQSKYGSNSNGVSIVHSGATDKWSHMFYPSIVATDYVNYMVFVVCWTDFDPSTLTFNQRSMTRILGRRPTLSDDIVKTLTALIASYNVDVSGHKHNDATKCGW